MHSFSTVTAIMNAMDFYCEFVCSEDYNYYRYWYNNKAIKLVPNVCCNISYLILTEPGSADYYDLYCNLCYWTLYPDNEAQTQKFEQFKDAHRGGGLARIGCRLLPPRKKTMIQVGGLVFSLQEAFFSIFCLFFFIWGCLFSPNGEPFLGLFPYKNVCWCS